MHGFSGIYFTNPCFRILYFLPGTSTLPSRVSIHKLHTKPQQAPSAKSVGKWLFIIHQNLPYRYLPTPWNQLISHLPESSPETTQKVYLLYHWLAIKLSVFRVDNVHCHTNSVYKIMAFEPFQNFGAIITYHT